MITRGQLRELHGMDLPLHILEQDYVQSLFLQELYATYGSFVFKGGTYMKHVFGLDRFSEDLDFTLKEATDPLKTIESTARRMGSYGVSARIERPQDRDVSFTAALRYRGPLYNGSENSMGTIRIEISKRDDIFLDPEWTRLFFKYPESPVVNVLGLRREEVLAEKIRALSTRSKGRDLYDVWFLLEQGIVPDPSLFERKMSVFGRDPVVRIGIDERGYTKDLHILMMRPPEYGMVKKKISRALKENGFRSNEE